MPQIDQHTGEDWAALSKIYKQVTTGGVSRSITAILQRLDARRPFSTATAILDAGTGPGSILSRLIAEHGAQIPPSCSLLATDFSAAMIERVRETQREHLLAATSPPPSSSSQGPPNPWARVETAVLDAMDLRGVPTDSQSHVTAGLVFFMTPDPQRCLRESLRVLAPGGVLGCSSWRRSDWMDMTNETVLRVRPDKTVPEIPREWAEVGLLGEELERAGFRGVEAVEVGVEMGIEDYDAFVDVMTEKLPHMVALLKDFSAEERQRLKDLIMARLRELVPSLPGKLHGTALVAVGQK